MVQYMTSFEGIQLQFKKFIREKFNLLIFLLSLINFIKLSYRFLLILHYM